MYFPITLFIIAYGILLLIILYVTSKITKNKKAHIAVFVLWLLIPTWDLFLGYPVYWYLDKYESGIKVYKRINNVEGFYVGEKNRNCEPNEPYSGYRYIDYKEKESGKYYRKYRLPDTTSAAGLQSVGTKEIMKSAVSPYWLCDDSLYHQHGSIILSLLNLAQPAPLLIQNRHKHQPLGELDYYRWQGSWMVKMISSVGVEPRRGECGSAANNPGTVFFVHSILKSTDVSAHNGTSEVR